LVRETSEKTWSLYDSPSDRKKECSTYETVMGWVWQMDGEKRKGTEVERGKEVPDLREERANQQRRTTKEEKGGTSPVLGNSTILGCARPRKKGEKGNLAGGKRKDFCILCRKDLVMTALNLCERRKEKHPKKY